MPGSLARERAPIERVGAGLQAGAVTGVGSLPGEDPGAALELVR